jgi:hypothetical protein
LRSFERVEPPGAAPDRVFSRGDDRNGITIVTSSDLLRIEARGDVEASVLLDCFRETFDAGALQPNMVSLVDISALNGGVDWQVLHEIAAMAPRASRADRSSRTAYVTKSGWFAAMLKLTAVLFPKSQHRQFSDVETAMAWLMSKE